MHETVQGARMGANFRGHIRARTGSILEPVSDAKFSGNMNNLRNLKAIDELRELYCRSLCFLGVVHLPIILSWHDLSALSMVKVISPKADSPIPASARRIILNDL